MSGFLLRISPWNWACKHVYSPSLWDAKFSCLPLKIQSYSASRIYCLSLDTKKVPSPQFCWQTIRSPSAPAFETHGVIALFHGNRDQKSVKSELWRVWATETLVLFLSGEARQSTQVSSWQCWRMTLTARVPLGFLPRTGLDFLLPQPQNVPASHSRITKALCGQSAQCEYFLIFLCSLSSL